MVLDDRKFSSVYSFGFSLNSGGIVPDSNIANYSEFDIVNSIDIPTISGTKK